MAGFEVITEGIGRFRFRLSASIFQLLDDFAMAPLTVRLYLEISDDRYQCRSRILTS
jgi:hypothetical protein